MIYMRLSILWSCDHSVPPSLTLIPYDRPHLKQMHEEHKGSVSPQVPVNERQRELGQHRRNQHECNSQSHPHHVFRLMVSADEHGGTYELCAVQDRRPQHAEGWIDFTVVDHHHDTVLTRVRGGLLRHHLRDVMLARLVVFHLSHFSCTLYVSIRAAFVPLFMKLHRRCFGSQMTVCVVHVCELVSNAHCHICSAGKESSISIYVCSELKCFKACCVPI